MPANTTKGIRASLTWLLDERRQMGETIEKSDVKSMTITSAEEIKELTEFVTRMVKETNESIDELDVLNPMLDKLKSATVEYSDKMKKSRMKMQDIMSKL